MEAADVDAVVAEYGADAADDAGHVAAARDEHVARRDGLDAEAVDLRNAPVRLLPEERARHRVLAGDRADARPHRLARLRARAVALRDRDRDAAPLPHAARGDAGDAPPPGPQSAR